MSCRSAPGQWPEELGSADAVPEAGGPVRGLVGVGDPPGVLSAVPQQVQSDRTVLVGPGAEVERRVAELLEGGPAMRPADDLEGPASHRETLVRRVSRRRSRCGPGDEAVRGTTATFGDPAEVRHSHQAKGRRVAGKVILAGRLTGQGLAAIATALPGLPGGVELTDDGREQGVAPEVVVVVEVLVAQSQAEDPLGEEISDGGSSVFKCEPGQKGPSDRGRSVGSARSSNRSLRTPDSGPGSGDSTGCRRTSGHTPAW